MPPITPELISTWAGSIAAAIVAVGAALKKAGWMTLHKRKDAPSKKPAGVIQCETGIPCKEHELIAKRVTDVEAMTATLTVSIQRISEDLAYIKGKLEQLSGEIGRSKVR